MKEGKFYKQRRDLTIHKGEFSKVRRIYIIQIRLGSHVSIQPQNKTTKVICCAHYTKMKMKYTAIVQSKSRLYKELS